MKFLDCTLVNIGSLDSWTTGKKSASATIPEGFYCPRVIDNTLWLEGGYGKMQFAVTQDGTKVSVKRIDSQYLGIRMDLKFHCCKNNGMCVNILGHESHN